MHLFCQSFSGDSEGFYLQIRRKTRHIQLHLLGKTEYRKSNFCVKFISYFLYLMVWKERARGDRLCVNGPWDVPFPQKMKCRKRSEMPPVLKSGRQMFRGELWPLEAWLAQAWSHPRVKLVDGHYIPTLLLGWSPCVTPGGDNNSQSTWSFLFVFLNYIHSQSLSGAYF